MKFAFHLKHPLTGLLLLVIPGLLFAQRTPLDEPIESWVSHIMLQRLGWGESALEGKPECRLTFRGAILFAPGAPESFKRYVTERFGGVNVQYQIFNRWTFTASGSTGPMGNPITLTYSFVPDGTFIPNDGLGSGNSNLQAVLTSQFGSSTLWRQKFAEAFARWSQLTGLNIVLDNDDGAPFRDYAGVLGVRGDVRIGGFGFNPQVLAYNYFPNVGDMVLNTNINWGGNSGNNWRLLRNTVMHEHGHGFGLNHVGPNDGTKLLEEFLNTNFDGPQDDDIQGGQRLYGDDWENNDSASTANNVGTVTNGMAINDLSTDDDADRDWYRLIIPAGKTVTITCTPVGRTYLQGPAGGPYSSRSSHMINDLAIRVYDDAGTTLLASVNNTGRGSSEVLSNFVPPRNNTIKLLIENVSPFTDDIQRYRLSFNLAPLTEGYVPENFSLPRGILMSGNLQSLFNSDDNRLEIRPGFVLNQSEPPVQLVVESTARTDTIARLQFRLEARVNTQNISQSIQLFNFQTNSYETVDTRPATLTDSIVDIDITTNASRFVQPGTNLIRARITYISSGLVLIYPWLVGIDQTVWTITYP